MSNNRSPYWYVHTIPIDLMDDFPDHPFKVEMDDDMRALIESINNNGVIDPLILRVKDDGRYEIIAGHRRKKACEYLGIKEVPAETRRMSREEATILMIESNLHRSHILPSEKAFAYKMRLEAMKAQGARNDLTSTPVAWKSRGTESADTLGSMFNESGDQVRRFIHLTDLIPSIMDMVDEEKMGMRPAVEISYLKKEEQEQLLDAMRLTDSTPSHSQAIKLRSLSKEGKLDAHVIENILREQKPNQREQIRVRYELAKKYLPRGMAFSELEEYILRALKYYSMSPERKREEEMELDLEM